MKDHAHTAAVLLIGNELLSGKIADKNLHFLAKELFALGIRLRRVVVCEDSIETIAQEIRTLRSHHDVVFTTGGVGPTHDDVTPEALALAFQLPLIFSQEILDIVRQRFGDELNDGHRRLALMPEGGELVSDDQAPWPTVCCNDVYVFPGVPDIVRAKWPPVRERLRNLGSPPMFSCVAFLSIDEFSVAAALRAVAERHPDVSIGSYLSIDDSSYKTKLTFDGPSRELIHEARSELLAALSDDVLLRLEG